MVRHLVPGVLVVLSCGAAWAADRSPTRLDANRTLLTAALVGECRASDHALEKARIESARVWSRADVDIRWVGASEVPYESTSAQWLLVRCREESAAGTDPGAIVPIATIRFIGARPTNTITLSIANAMTLLLRDAPDTAGQRGWFIPDREARLGRMLGRAIAHEIGHFLSQSGAHTRTGLMRATHTVAALTGPSLGPFHPPDLSRN